MQKSGGLSEKIKISQIVSTANAKDLWTVLKEICLKKRNMDYIIDDYTGKRGIEEIMNTWFKAEHYPVLHVNRDYKAGHAYCGLTHLIDRRRNISWTIPLNYMTQSNLTLQHYHSYNLTNIIWHDSWETKVISHINPDDFLILNVEQPGKHRLTGLLYFVTLCNNFTYTYNFMFFRTF